MVIMSQWSSKSTFDANKIISSISKELNYFKNGFNTKGYMISHFAVCGFIIIQSFNFVFFKQIESHQRCSLPRYSKQGKRKVVFLGAIGTLPLVSCI